MMGPSPIGTRARKDLVFAAGFDIGKDKHRTLTGKVFQAGDP